MRWMIHPEEMRDQSDRRPPWWELRSPRRDERSPWGDERSIRLKTEVIKDRPDEITVQSPWYEYSLLIHVISNEICKISLISLMWKDLNYKNMGEEGRTVEGNKCLYQEVHQVRDGVFSVIIKKRENKAEPLKGTGVCTKRSIRSAMESSVSSARDWASFSRAIASSTRCISALICRERMNQW